MTPIGIELGTHFGFRYIGAGIGAGIGGLIAWPAYRKLGLFRRW
jgi:hypothetical protein